MAKHRKTRREKKIADHRHPIYHLEMKSPQVAIKPTVAKEKATIDHNNYKEEYPMQNNAISYAYVKHDLRKTLLLTSVIIVTQIVLFIILNRV